MKLAGLVMAMFLAFASMVPHGAVAAPPANTAQHHHQPPAPADSEDADCAAPCIGCSVAVRMPTAARHSSVSYKITHHAAASAAFAGVIIGFDPPPPRTRA